TTPLPPKGKGPQNEPRLSCPCRAFAMSLAARPSTCRRAATDRDRRAVFQRHHARLCLRVSSQTRIAHGKRLYGHVEEGCTKHSLLDFNVFMSGQRGAFSAMR